MENTLKPINKKEVKIKNLLGIIDEPTYIDLLFEIVQFLEDENRFDGIFKKGEVSQKTRCRINSEIIKDLDELEKLGYISKLKYTQFQVLKHPWEKE